MKTIRKWIYCEIIVKSMHWPMWICCHWKDLHQEIKLERCNLMKIIFYMSKGFSLKDLKKEFYCVCCMKKESSYLKTAMLNSYVVKNYINVLTWTVNLPDHFMDFDLFIHAVLSRKYVVHDQSLFTKWDLYSGLKGWLGFNSSF